jgi:hypothetical protein
MASPLHKNTCVKCGSHIPSQWGEVKSFYDDLAEAIPDGGDVAFQVFRTICEAREEAGRDHFGYRFLDRDNVEDAFEEAADGANYAAFEVRRLRRAGMDDQYDAALSAAWHFFQAFKAMNRLREKERGQP